MDTYSQNMIEYDLYDSSFCRIISISSEILLMNVLMIVRVPSKYKCGMIM